MTKNTTTENRKSIFTPGRAVCAVGALLCALSLAACDTGSTAGCGCAPGTAYYDEDCGCPAGGTDKCGCTNTRTSIEFINGEFIPVIRGEGVLPEEFVASVNNLKSGYDSTSDGTRSDLAGKIKEIRIVSSFDGNYDCILSEGKAIITLKFGRSASSCKNMLNDIVDNALPGLGL